MLILPDDAKRERESYPLSPKPLAILQQFTNAGFLISYLLVGHLPLCIKTASLEDQGLVCLSAVCAPCSLGCQNLEFSGKELQPAIVLLTTLSHLHNS